jgi:hypothetical protein
MIANKTKLLVKGTIGHGHEQLKRKKKDPNMLYQLPTGTVAYVPEWSLPTGSY